MTTGSRPHGLPLLRVAVMALACLSGGWAAGTPRPSGESPPAYLPVEVTHGGSVTGRVLVEDPPPPHGNHSVTRDHRICGRSIADERLILSEDGALGNVVVSLEGITRGRPVNLAERPRLVNAGCRYVPHVMSMSVGQKLEIVNGDPVLHNTHARMDGVKTVFNIALPVQNHKIPKLITEPGAMKVQCDAGHGWMSAWVVAFDHPYHDVTGEDGAFRIEGIPPGRYTLRAWHEELGTQRVEISVVEGGGAKVEFRHLSR